MAQAIVLKKERYWKFNMRLAQESLFFKENLEIRTNSVGIVSGQDLYYNGVRVLKVYYHAKKSGFGGTLVTSALHL